MLLLVVQLTIIHVCVSSGSLLVSESEPFEFESYQVLCSKVASDVTVGAEIVVAEPFEEGCSSFSNSAAFDGKVVLVGHTGCSPLHKAEKVRESGAVGVFYGLSIPLGPDQVANDPDIDGCSSYDDSVDIPVHIIGLEVREVLLQKLATAKNASVTMQSSSNPWVAYESDPGSYVAQVIMLAWPVVNMFFAGNRLYQWIKISGKLEYRPAHVALIMEIIANTIRFIWCLDPWHIRHFKPWILSMFTLLSSMPFTITTTNLVSIFWLAAVSTKNKVSHQNHDTRAWIGVWMTFAITGILEIVSSSLRTAYVFFVFLNILNGGSYVLLMIIQIGFILFVTHKVIRTLWPTLHLTRISSSRKLRLLHITGLMVVSAFGNLIMIVGLVLQSAAPASIRSPGFMMFFSTLMNVGANLNSISQIFAFRTPVQSNSDSGSNNSRSNTGGSRKSKSKSTNHQIPSGRSVAVTSAVSNVSDDDMRTIQRDPSAESQELNALGQVASDDSLLGLPSDNEKPSNGLQQQSSSEDMNPMNKVDSTSSADMNPLANVTSTDALMDA